jgi:thiamine-monophosphate kinase
VDTRKDILFTTDMIIEGRHFRLSEAKPYEIGWKAMAVNVSDIAAMGGRPTFAVVSVGLPAGLGLPFVDELNRGLREAAARFGAAIVGGDTNRSDKLTLAVAVLGEVERGRALTRSGAKPGDIVFVTGSLGGSYRSGKHLNFIPRVQESRYLTGHFKVHSMIDVSDGLASDLRRLSEESGVGFVIAADAVPLSRHAKNLTQALTEGEDFELLFTLSPKEAAHLTSSVIPRGLARFHPIGKVVPKRYGICIEHNGKLRPLAEKGFDHFK